MTTQQLSADDVTGVHCFYPARFEMLMPGHGSLFMLELNTIPLGPNANTYCAPTLFSIALDEGPALEKLRQLTGGQINEYARGAASVHMRTDSERTHENITGAIACVRRCLVDNITPELGGYLVLRDIKFDCRPGRVTMYCFSSCTRSDNQWDSTLAARRALYTVFGPSKLIEQAEFY